MDNYSEAHKPSPTVCIGTSHFRKHDHMPQVALRPCCANFAACRMQTGYRCKCLAVPSYVRTPVRTRQVTNAAPAARPQPSTSPTRERSPQHQSRLRLPGAAFWLPLHNVPESSPLHCPIAEQTPHGAEKTCQVGRDRCRQQAASRDFRF
jgi:hypothetical protein